METITLSAGYNYLSTSNLSFGVWFEMSLTEGVNTFWSPNENIQGAHLEEGDTNFSSESSHYAAFFGISSSYGKQLNGPFCYF